MHFESLEEKYEALNSVLKQENKLLQEQITEMTHQNLNGHQELKD